MIDLKRILLKRMDTDAFDNISTALSNCYRVNIGTEIHYIYNGQVWYKYCTDISLLLMDERYIKMNKGSYYEKRHFAYAVFNLCTGINVDYYEFT